MNDVLKDEKTSIKEEKATRLCCKYCGNEIAYISKYCPTCGEKLF